jgi:hypothetical protein
VRLFDVSPLEPFCTLTLKLPPAKIATPSNSEELLANSALFAMIHVVDARPHPGPSNETITLFGSKSVPVIENVNAWALRGGFGAVVSVRS